MMYCYYYILLVSLRLLHLKQGIWIVVNEQDLSCHKNVLHQ